MAVILKLMSGSWRAQVRRKGRYASGTFVRKKDAEEWALETERSIDQGLAISVQPKKHYRTFRDLINLHIKDMHDVGRPIRRSKSAVMEALKTSIGRTRINELSRAKLIEFGKMRAKQGAGPVTLAIDISYIRTVLTHAAAVHGIEVSAENVRLARIALVRLGLIGRSNERDRRPTPDEIDDLIEYFEKKTNQIIPMDRIIRFAIATAMRQEEICRIGWQDIDLVKRTAKIRDRKDPRKKDGNHQKVPLLNISGFDAWTVLLEQKIITRGIGRVFPYNGRSVGAAFRRACKNLDIEDLRFHDLRHEATSRLFEAGLPIQQVALVTGHKDWKTLRRYTNLKPEDLHALQKQPQPSDDEHISMLLRM